MGFSEVQISQVVDSCGKWFTLKDILDNVEIWDLKHARNILEIMFQVFGDICDDVHAYDSCSYMKDDVSFVGDYDILNYG